MLAIVRVTFHGRIADTKPLPLDKAYADCAILRDHGFDAVVIPY